MGPGPAAVAGPPPLDPAHTSGAWSQGQRRLATAARPLDGLSGPGWPPRACLGFHFLKNLD